MTTRITIHNHGSEDVGVASTTYNQEEVVQPGQSVFKYVHGDTKIVVRELLKPQPLPRDQGGYTE